MQIMWFRREIIYFQVRSNENDAWLLAISQRHVKQQFARIDSCN